MNNAVAVSGTLGPYRQLVDGTLSVQITIDPRFRADFHAMFDIDMGVALVPLTQGAAIEPVGESKAEIDHRQIQPAKKPANKPVSSEGKEPAKRAAFPPGLCGLAVRWCNDDHFQQWLSVTYPDQYGEAFADDNNSHNEDVAAAVIRSLCNVSSRKDIDGSAIASTIFKEQILEPYSEVRKRDGLE